MVRPNAARSLDVVRRVHEGTFGEADTAGGHDGPHGVESEHGESKAPDLANDVFGGNSDVGEHQLTGVDSLHPHLVIGAADLDALEVPLDDECGHRIVGPAGHVTAGLREHRVPVRLAHPRHPTLGPIEDPTVGVIGIANPAGAHAHDVAPGLGLGKTESGPGRAIGNAGKVAELLLLGPRNQDRASGQAGQQQHQRSAVGVLGHFFNGYCQSKDAGSGAPVFGGNTKAEQFGVAKGGEEVVGVSPLAIDLSSPRFDLVLGQSPDRLLQGGHVVGEVEIHP